MAGVPRGAFRSNMMMFTSDNRGSKAETEEMAGMHVVEGRIDPKDPCISAGSRKKKENFKKEKPTKTPRTYYLEGTVSET